MYALKGAFIKKQAILTLTTGVMLLSACSKVEEVDKRTKTMTDTTIEMAKTTGDMKDVTSHMYPQIRTKEARQRLFVDAANEFFRRAADIYNRIDTSKLTPTIDDAGLAAKGAALLAKLSHGKYGKVKLTSLFEGANEAIQKEINKRLDG